ncbi:FosX/FosE/FosI family fosfomycin resistance hydrolase [Desulfospira joergensenii]|uniref:FosX/FosE/FosI family fosfomycin resistance hydrolase n=1 Tax=Desulfospira joergensenii TaxID=53329 RepID=UPI0003B63B19|nr:FosX/FosE/FosI family fosfomycin resistance hydrolase [Desulfospira joergensenii]
MIESISHITFVVKDVKRTAELFRSVFHAKEVYDSSHKNFSVSYEKFFLIGHTWIAVMEGESSLERSYNHIAFKVSEGDFDSYIKKIREFGLEIVKGRDRIKGEARSVYFYDYDHHLFELHTGTLSQRLSSYRKHERL